MTPLRRSALWEPATSKRDRRLHAVSGVACIAMAIATVVGGYAAGRPSRSVRASLAVHDLAFDKYRGWRDQHPLEICPQRLARLHGPLIDPWRRAFAYTCDHRLIRREYPIEVISAGEDGIFGTADDIRSLP